MLTLYFHKFFESILIFIKQKFFFIFLAFFIVVIEIISGCEINDTDNSFQPRILAGESKSFGLGVVTSIIETDENDIPTAIGVVFTSAALEGLDTTNLSVTLRMPQTVASTQFDHIVVEWNPEGHSPEGIYDIPHFDFRFYIINEAEQNSISGIGADSIKMYRQPDSQFVPKDYKMIPNSGTPKIGVHFYDIASTELKGVPFDKTLIYDFYDGKIVSIEPMITKSFFETKTTFVGDIKQPEKFQLPGFYPLQYNIKFTGSQSKYTVALINLTRR